MAKAMEGLFLLIIILLIIYGITFIIVNGFIINDTQISLYVSGIVDVVLIAILIFMIRRNEKNKAHKYYSVQEMIDNYENLSDDEKKYVEEYLDDPKTMDYSGRPRRR